MKKVSSQNAALKLCRNVKAVEKVTGLKSCQFQLSSETDLSRSTGPGIQSNCR